MKALAFESMPVIQVEHLAKRYEIYRRSTGFLGSLKSFFFRKTFFAEAVKDISFSVGEGELVGFLGPNGAGKTTTLKMLSGIVRQTSGYARVLGFDPYRRERSYQKQFALVMGQKNQLLSDLPALESFALLKEIYGLSQTDYRRQLDELVATLDVSAILDIPVRKLSLGQRMRCELVAALLHRPRVLFLDEPTIGLDVVAQKSIREFIKRYNRETKTTIMLTSHYMDDIQELCERVVVINLGVIVFDGALKDVVARYAPYKMLKATFTGKGVCRQDIASYGDIETCEPYRCAIRVARSDIKDVAAAMLSSGLPVDDIFIGEVGVDEVVRRIFAETSAAAD